MEYILITAVLVFAIVMYAGRRERRLLTVTNHFYSNSKPYLEQMGFEGEAGWCSELPDFIDNLYRLQDPGRSGAFSDLPPGLVGELYANAPEPRPCANTNRYSIAFMATVTAKSNLGVLTLTVDRHEDGDVQSDDVVCVYAPISHFSRTGLSSLLRFFRFRIDQYEKSPVKNPLWLIAGLNSDHKVCDLPYLELKDNVPKSAMKQAKRLMVKGYPN